jgi:hypothetical protein
MSHTFCYTDSNHNVYCFTLDWPDDDNNNEDYCLVVARLSGWEEWQPPTYCVYKYTNKLILDSNEDWAKKNLSQEAENYINRVIGLLVFS